MKTFSQWLENQPYPIHDRSLEIYDDLLKNLTMATKSILDPEIQQEFWGIVNPLE